MKKIFSSILVFFVSLIFLIFPNEALSQEQFQIDADVEYVISETGETYVTHDITLTNLYSNLYATNYQLSLDNINPNNIKAVEGGVPLTVTEEKLGTATNVNIAFDNVVAGKGKQRKFSISFTEDSFATKTGEVWEISIPKLASADFFSKYQSTLMIPKSFGEIAYLSPEPTSQSVEKENIFVFTKEDMVKSGISAGFGMFQVFSFTLNYHLENPLSKEAITEIALPPDTPYQKVYYENLTPKPKTVEEDVDGNWIATYRLKKRERIDVVATGSVQIFSFPRRIFPENTESLNQNLQESKYWQVNDPRIQNLAKTFKTPKAIYDYVVNSLSYDYVRVRPNVERLGASSALKNPNSAICMEFTDLFIAISRAAGIPAREINGFAYSESPEIQPLSLVADVLHAWPEYWNENLGHWVPVDPTWGSTSGIDYFEQMDLRHFTFVIHGNNPTQPYPPGSYKLGSNPQKDVFVNLGQLPKLRTSLPSIMLSKTKTIPFFDTKMKANIYNSGPSALYDVDIKVYFDDEISDSYMIDEILPYSSHESDIFIPFSLLGKNTPKKVTYSVSGSDVEAPAGKTFVIIYNLLVILVIVSAIIVYILVKLGKIKLRFFKRNKNNENNNAQKTEGSQNIKE